MLPFDSSWLAALRATSYSVRLGQCRQPVQPPRASSALCAAFIRLSRSDNLIRQRANVDLCFDGGHLVSQRVEFVGLGGIVE